MIKVIMFDLGGVLVKLKDEKIFLEFLIQNSEFKNSDFQKMEWLIETINKGTFSVRDAYHFLCEEYKFNGSYLFFESHFNSLIIGEENGNICDFLESIKLKYQIVLLSNTNAVHFQYVKDNYGLFSYFDNFFLSYKLKLMKPDIFIFKSVLSAMRYKPEEILFIDDSELNIQAAELLGIKVIHNERNVNPIPKIQSFLQL